MKNPKVSIVIPLYKPELEVLKKLRNSLKKQTIKAEVIENWNMPEARSMNTGIKKASGEIIVTLAQDCIPENEFWLEKLIKPLKDKKVIVTISDLHLPEKYWKTYSFLTRLFTLSDRNDKTPGFDARACAYRKKDLIKAGLFDENPKVIGIDLELGVKLQKIGEFKRANVRVFHLHKLNSFKEVIRKTHFYSEANGKAIKQLGLKLGIIGFWIRIIKSIPLFGSLLIIGRFPFRNYFYLFPLYLLIVVPTIHSVNLLGFWKGFFMDKESVRNLEVLKE
ncbi:MAG: glycosyltransferase [Nanoarchaeota archaeon]